MMENTLFDFIYHHSGAAAAKAAVIAVEALLAAAMVAAVWFALSRKRETKSCRAFLFLLLPLLLCELLLLLPQARRYGSYGASDIALYNTSVTAAKVLLALTLVGVLLAAVLYRHIVKKKAVLRGILWVAALVLGMEFVWLFPYATAPSARQAPLELVGTYETPHEEKYPFFKTYYSFGSGDSARKSAQMPGSPLGWSYEDENAWLADQTYDFDHYTYLVICGQKLDAVELILWTAQNTAPYPLTRLTYVCQCVPELNYEPAELEQALYLYRMERVAVD